MDSPATPCFSCADGEGLDPSQPERAIWLSDGWRVVHSFNSSLLGWLVIVPRRHIESMHELSDAEAAVLGPLVRDVSGALVRVLGCAKTYVIMLAEAPGFTHLHVHVVPRAHDMPEEFRGTQVFGYLKRPSEEWVPLDARRDLALRLRAAAVERTA